ncbi:MAG: PAS domain S-box protein [Fulvivirga sp.]
MFKRIKISTKITGLVIAMVVITLLAVGYVSYHMSKRDIRERFSNNILITAQQRSSKLNHYFEQVRANLEFLSTNQIIVEGTVSTSESEVISFEEPTNEFDDSDLGSEEPTDEFEESDLGSEEAIFEDVFDFSEPEAAKPVYDVPAFLNSIKQAFGYPDIFITETNGVIKYSTSTSLGAGSNFIDPDGRTISEVQKGAYIGNIVKQGSEYISYAGKPIDTSSGSRLLLLIKVDVEDIFNIVQDTTALGKSGEVILAQLDSVRSNVYFQNLLRNDSTSSLKWFEKSSREAELITSSFSRPTGSAMGIDYRSEPVLAAWSKVAVAGWNLVVKIDDTEVLAEINRLTQQFLLTGLVLLGLTVIASLIFSRYLTGALDSLKSTLELVGNGILPENINRKSNDEIGLMANSLNYLVQTLKKTAGFAQQIGEGNFDANFKPISQDDALGNALVGMRDNLIEGEKRDKERNWIVTGVAEIGEILRAHNDINELGDEVIHYIIGKIDAVQGAFYVTSDDETDPHLDMKASYAYNRKKHLEMRFRFAEGLVGQAAAEMDTVLRTEIPADYVSITSGILGDQRPTAILVVPLITQEKVYGVLEFAGFKKFDASKVKFVEELSVILARTVFNIKINERTRLLLSESQTMSSELQEKQEILRQNAEEMQATQEELQKSNTKLEEQIEEVNRTQKRMQLLLENASEVITIYEEDETVRYISPSVEPILGYTQKEMMGKSDFDKVGEEFKDAFRKMFATLKDKPEEQVTLQYEYKTKEGDYIWIESTGTNFMSNPAIHGLIVNSTDITERRRAEQEQRMRSKMQALSENSPDLITRLEEDSISYINPVIEEYTGNAPDNYLNQKFGELDLNSAILDRWLEIVEEVNTSNDKVSTEMDFPSEMGDRVMQVNAIPEFDEQETLESVLVVSHDITERKIIELEIQNKNKKIADSINYAKRIQNAILPNNNVINRVLPDSFILYKPKDVVSGDFPWYVQMGDEIYMAAVDCTGHGVPGALLSLIGYFLLNDIVRSRKVSDPGLILDQLDEGVTTTLRQDQDDSKTKDGMDIALCKINPEKREIEYAGAHRPLYMMKKGEMEEVKGNKFAIGGGIYKNQTNFTTYSTKLSKGDSIYFCSDGFPDQFGGPDNRKFGPRRTRDLIAEIHEKSMREAYQIFDNEWEGWKGDEKQTDDVLLIGIKF